MKKKWIGIALVSTLLLSGCSNAVPEGFEGTHSGAAENTGHEESADQEKESFPEAAESTGYEIPEDAELIAPGELQGISEEEIREMEELENMSVSDSLTVTFPLPEALEQAVDFSLYYAERESNEAFLEEFKSMFAYLMPEEELDEDYLYYYGANSQVEIDDEGNMISDLHLAKDWKNEIISGEEDVLFFLYDEGRGEESQEKKPVLLEFTSPACNDLFRFNKGKAAELGGWTGSMEICDSASLFPVVGEYAPESTESYMLLDQEMRICDAVAFYEDYINHLPTAAETPLKVKVTRVIVHQLDQTHYGYFFVTTLALHQIPFESMKFGETFRTIKECEYQFAFVNGQGFMSETEDVEYADGASRV